MKQKPRKPIHHYKKKHEGDELTDQQKRENEEHQSAVLAEEAQTPEVISSSYESDGKILFERLGDASVRISSEHQDYTFCVVLSEVAWQEAKANI